MTNFTKKKKKDQNIRGRSDIISHYKKIGMNVKGRGISFPSIVHPSMQWALRISEERKDREQTGDLFQKLHREDPVR